MFYGGGHGGIGNPLDSGPTIPTQVKCGFLVEARKQDGSFLGLQLPIGRFELTGNGTGRSSLGVVRQQEEQLLTLFRLWCAHSGEAHRN